MAGRRRRSNIGRSTVVARRLRSARDEKSSTEREARRSQMRDRYRAERERESSVERQWVNLDLSNEEKRQAKMDFCQKYGFPGAILCVDGTHIKIVAPAKDKFLYFNRKGYYSINAMIICDNKMRIRYVNAQYPGSNHDAHIWNVSSARNFFENKYLNGERNTWLLGDAGYALEPWLMTPFRSPTTGSAEGNYNKIHAKARNTIERTIGVFKNRFRCLLGARELYYEPMKVCQIVNVAAALHNICMH
ncbi:putative nuclease HARBI1 [Anastrepha ludens]|uniref:putative nuclease HARBI1 n=1 Tax=Anastrepha ludens TaxID=28586 RepID=UPI0023B03B2E|nr:putative nuclease HARBI1 [Anastrepha ludens]